MNTTNFLFVLSSLAGTTHAATIHVDASNPNCPGIGTPASPYCTIQAALNVAVNGDVVLVQPGIYAEHINFLGKSLRLESAQGPSVTAIRPNPQSTLSPVSFVNGENDDTWIVGFDIGATLGTPNQVPLGSGTAGGSILVRDASPRIVGNWFRQATNVAAGGAIACLGGSPRIHGNKIDAANVAVRGGGVYLDGCGFIEIFDNDVEHQNAEMGAGFYLDNCLAPRFERNAIHDNAATLFGGGLFVEDGLTVMVDDIFHGNHAGNGGGIAAQDVLTLQFERVTLTDNAALGEGGGLWRNGTGQLVLSHSRFEGCSATQGGGIRSNSTSLVVIADCEFVANEAAEFGCGAFLSGVGIPPLVTRSTFRGHSCFSELGIASGALMMAGRVEDCLFYDNQKALVPTGGSIDIRRCTFTANTVAVDAWWTAGSVQMTSSICWSNGEGATPFHGLIAPDGKINATYCDVMGGFVGAGNISADPQFVMAALSDYRLLSTSPCIEAGSTFNSSCGTDIAGRPRRVAGTFGPVALVDQGAHEFSHVSLALGSAPTGFVNIESTGTAGLATMLLIGMGEGSLCAPPAGTILFNLNFPWFRIDWAPLPSQILVPLPLGPLPASVKLQQIALGPNGGANLSNAVTVVLD